MNQTRLSALVDRYPFRRLFKKSFLFIAGLAVALLLTEVGLRLSGFSHFNPYIVDREVGFSLRPNAAGWWRKEGVTYIRINSQGLRDREHTIAKPSDTVRIAVLGDSFAEAFQVPMEKTFWTVMEQRLAQCGVPAGKKVEVINFGVSGFSTARELIMLRQRVWQYSPDIVLLLVTTRNDVRDNSSALDPYKNSGLPYFVYRDGSLKLDDSRLQARNHSFSFRLQQSFIGKSFDWLRAHSRLVGLLDAAREGSLWRRKPTDRKDSYPGEPGLDDEVFRAPANSDWYDAWNVTEKLIVQIGDEVNAKGAKFLVVTGSSGLQVSPDTSLRDAYMKRLAVNTLFYSELRIKALGEREGFEVLTLAPLLLDYATRNQTFLHGSVEMKGTGHWNETGHRVVGELIAEKLCKLGWSTTTADH
ncbi:MAG: SGNH/GDSL hydrolase family protein [bacterium]